MNSCQAKRTQDSTSFSQKKEKLVRKGISWTPATPREHNTHPYSTSPSSAFSALKLWFESF